MPLLSAAAGALLGAGGMYALRRPAMPAPQPLAPSLDGLDIAFYRYDVASGLEECSQRLRQLLSLGDFEINWSTLLHAFPAPHRSTLVQARAETENGKGPVMISLNLENGKRQMECIFAGRFNAEGALTQLAMQCRDLSATHGQNERLLRENEQVKREIRQYATLLNALPMPVWMRGEDASIRYCNLAYSSAAEEDEARADGQGQEALELTPYAKALARTVLEAGQIRSERRHVIMDGARRFYEFTEIAVTEGARQGTVGVAVDMTELEQAQNQLQLHINAQSDLLESVTSAMAVFGSDQRLASHNFAFQRLWGLEEAWLGTRPTYGELLETLREKRRLPEQANFPMFKQQHLKLFTDLLEPREEIFYLPDGRTLRVLAIPHALGGILFAYEDVTDRLALERSYNTLIAVQKATLDNLHEGVVVFGEDGRLRLYNPRFLQLWKLEKAVLSQETHIADLVEKTRALHPTQDWASYKMGFIGQLMGREVRLHRLERADGSVIDYIVVPLPDGASLVTFMDATASTLVERSLRERNDALQEADRVKTEFLANVSYDLRSPLTSISGFAEMLAQNYFGELTPRQREYVGNIHDASQQLMHLINNILDIASVEAGYMRLDVSECDIRALLQSVVARLQDRLAAQRVQFTLNCPPGIGSMLADETRMKQIVFNLISNAIKYTEPGGAITLAASAAMQAGQEEITIRVTDTGVGIAPQEQMAVWDKFYRGGAVGAPKSGAGLGLSMVKSFVELHGGRVALQSAPGQGTSISCTFLRRNLRLLAGNEPIMPAL